MAVKGIGVDLVEIQRMRFMIEKWGERFYRKVFTDEEIAYCLSRSRPYYSFAARFAAKEAFAKALGTGIGKVCGWKDVFVRVHQNGGPEIGLSEKLRDRLTGHHIFLSLSHTQTMAIAMVVIDEDGKSGQA